MARAAARATARTGPLGREPVRVTTPGGTGSSLHASSWGTTHWPGRPLLQPPHVRRQQVGRRAPGAPPAFSVRDQLKFLGQRAVPPLPAAEVRRGGAPSRCRPDDRICVQQRAQPDDWAGWRLVSGDSPRILASAAALGAPRSSWAATLHGKHKQQQQQQQREWTARRQECIASTTEQPIAGCMYPSGRQGREKSPLHPRNHAAAGFCLLRRDLRVQLQYSAAPASQFGSERWQSD